MPRSTGTLRSQNAMLTTNQRTLIMQQRTATSNRTGGISSSAHTSSAHKVTEKQKPRVLDESNIDVTPKPMFDVENTSKPRHGSALFHSIEGTSTPTDILSNGSVLNTNAILTGAQSFGAFPESSTHVSSDSNQIPSDSVQDGGMPEREREFSALFITNLEKKAKKENTFERINLTETATYTLLDLPSTCLSNEDENAQIVKQNNQKYLELCNNKKGNDSYVERGISTFNDLPKIKSTQTERITITEKGVWCTAWDMFDSYNAADTDKSDKASDKISGQKYSYGSVNSFKSEGSESKTKSTSIETGTVISELNGANSNQHVVEISNKPFVDKNNSNYLEPKQARYRGFKPLAINEESHKEVSKAIQQYDGLSLEKLWTYSCSLTKDRNVSCIAWNMKNRDILAAGYGKFEYNDDQSGLVCCWSLKNPEFPERYFKTEAGVTALAFSQKHANLLAIGLFNGNILVFDVRNNNSNALLSTNESENKHLSPVWHLKWTDRDRSSATNEEGEEMEVLMSVSSDGRVTQWMIRKGFESSDYLKLKRVSSKGGAAAAANSSTKKEKEKSDGFISRHSGGLCFDIWDQDKSIYLCGTEEGFIHRCSTSYNEQYLDTYQGHTGPVYKLAWSPFLKNCFLSASGDWTIRLWKANRTNPCLTFNSSSKAVYDICWSNHSATLFCCVNETTIELWDLSKSTLDPIYTTNSPGSAKLTSITYSPNSDSLIVGTSEGSLWIYAIKNMPAPTTSSDLDEIIKQSLISQLESIRGEEDDTKENIEKQQMDQLNNKDDDELEQQNEKMDALVGKVDKLKMANADILDKIKKKKGDQKEEDESSDDD